MKHLNYSLLVCAVGAMMLCSCNTRQAAINNLRSFNTELQAEANFYDLGDWKKAGKRYVRINKKLLKHSYNQEEMAEIGRLQEVPLEPEPQQGRHLHLPLPATR